MASLITATLSAQTPPQEFPSETTSVPAPDAYIEGQEVFLGPFTSESFLRTVQEEMLRRKLILERMTGIYIDLKRNLIWSSHDNGRDIDWKRAAEYCEQLELAAFDDWRMPSLTELETLMQPMARKHYNTPDGMELTACCPWSTTKKDDIAAWNYNFRYRKPFSGSMTHTFDLRALCVRDPTAEDLMVQELALEEAEANEEAESSDG